MSTFRKGIFVFLIFLGNISHATTYYVSTTGNNNNIGTKDRPFLTIAYAVSKMVAGDTTYVRGGIYKETLISFGRSGSPSARIQLLNFPGEFPVIDFGLVKHDETRVYRLQFKSSSGYSKPIGWITIEGFEIRRGYNGIKFYNLHNSIIRRNWVHHNVLSGILGIGGHHNVFDRNKVNHNGPFNECATGELTICNQSHGIYMYGNYHTVTNNLIYDNLGFGIQINGSSTSVYNSTLHAGTEFAGAKNWTIANNTFAYNHYRGGITLWGSPKDMRIENNIFHENCVIKEVSKCAYAQGIEFTGSGTRGAVIRNNLFYATGAGAVLPYSRNAVAGVNYTHSGNIVNTLNPKFVNAPATLPSSPNFALTSLSPAINKGIVTTTTKVDFVGRPRGTLYDIGAYEFLTGTSGLSAPLAPNNFQLREE